MTTLGVVSVVSLNRLDTKTIDDSFINHAIWSERPAQQHHGE